MPEVNMEFLLENAVGDFVQDRNYETIFLF